jgi:ankyrin repeat protein
LIINTADIMVTKSSVEFFQGVTTQENIASLVSNKNIISNLIKSPRGIYFLVNTTRDTDNWSALHELASREYYESAILEIISNKEVRKAFADAKTSSGWSALHEAVRHDSIALEIGKTLEGLELLKNTKTNSGWSALHEASKSIKFILELTQTEEGKKFMHSLKRIC